MSLLDHLPVLHPDVLRLILSFADGPTLAACLRVNHLFFEISGSIIYRSLDASNDRSPGTLWRAMVAGASLGGSPGARERSGKSRHTNFKRALFRHVRYVHLPQTRFCDAADIQAALGSMLALDTLKICAWEAYSPEKRAPAWCCPHQEACTSRQLRPRKVIINKMMCCTAFQHFRGNLQCADRLTLVFEDPVLWEQADIDCMRRLIDGLREVFPLDSNPSSSSTQSRRASNRRLRVIFTEIPFRWESESEDEEDALWRGVTECFARLLEFGADVYFITPPEEVLVQPLIGIEKFGVTDYLNRLVSDLLGEQEAIGSACRWIQSRADYLALSDTAHELDEDTMDKLRTEEKRTRTSQRVLWRGWGRYGGSLGRSCAWGGGAVLLSIPDQRTVPASEVC
jgi:hypothetical protein